VFSGEVWCALKRASKQGHGGVHTEMFGVVVLFRRIFGRCLVRVSARTPAILTGFSWFSSISSLKYLYNISSRPRSLLSKSFPIYKSSLTLLFDSTVLGTENRKVTNNPRFQYAFVFFKTLIGNPERKSPSGWPRHRWQNDRKGLRWHYAYLVQVACYCEYGN
jgi:hypothetical protein